MSPINALIWSNLFKGYSPYIIRMEVKTKMEKKQAKKILLEQGRYNHNVKSACEICKAFGLELDESLIRTTIGYRENIDDPTIPRVDINELAKNICERLGKKPDEEILAKAHQMSGEGSYRDLHSEAFAINL